MRISKQARREAKQLFRLCLVSGDLEDNRVRDVVRQVASDGRRKRLAVLTQFLRLIKSERAERTAIIESAVAVPAEVQSAIEAGLTHRYRRGLAATFNLRPALIGGVRIQVGSDVYDGSVLAGLRALGKRF